MKEPVRHKFFKLSETEILVKTVIARGDKPWYPHEGVHLLPLASVPFLVMLQHVAPGYLAGDVAKQGARP